MKRIGDRQYLQAWQVIRATTQPDSEATTWKIGDVTCRRHRYSLTSPQHTVVLEVCHVEYVAVRGSWHVMVTLETWWDSRHVVIRSQLWASHLSGSKEHALAWMHREAANRQRLAEEAESHTESTTARA